MRFWKRRTSGADRPAEQADTAPDAPPVFDPGIAANADTATADTATADAASADTDAAPNAVPASAVRTVQGRVERGGATPTLPAVTTVTAYRRDGTVAGTAVSHDGAYVLDGIPAEPLTLVAVDHPAVHEEVAVRAGDQRHDIRLPAFPRKDLA